MGEVLTDLGILAITIVGITAFLGVISSVIGINIFGGKKASTHVDQTLKTQAGWKAVGGKNK